MANTPSNGLLSRMLMRKSVEQVQRESETSTLKRTLGPWNLVFLGVGCIEVVSILFRLISLSFRLYGNVFGGENLIHSLGDLAPFVVPALAAGLEVLVGLIQAFVFTLLSAVYIGLICNHEGGHDEEHAH